MPRSVEFKNIAKSFASRPVLDDVCLRMAGGNVTALLGASGCGKTTLLRIAAGLEQPDRGEVTFSEEGNAVNGSASIGMVFQNLALWPHLTAIEHLLCVLAQQPRGRRRTIAEGLLREMSLPEAVWSQRPARLSGGEGQRLALARALAGEPDVLLLDEPLAHLDTPLRQELLPAILSAVAARRMTAIYVTHAWSEAVSVADQVAVLHGGRIVQHGSVAEVYWNPPSLEIARLTGPLVPFPANWLDQSFLDLSGKSGQCPLLREDDMVAVRPQQIVMTAAEGANRWQVQSCRPFETAWMASLRHASGAAWNVAVRQLLPVGAEVGVGIDGHDSGSLRSPMRCATNGQTEGAGDST